MLKSKTHFEQVPLEAVRKIVQEQLPREEIIGEGIDQGTLDNGSADAEEPSAAELANFLTGSYRNHT